MMHRHVLLLSCLNLFYLSSGKWPSRLDRANVKLIEENPDDDTEYLPSFWLRNRLGNLFNFTSCITLRYCKCAKNNDSYTIDCEIPKYNLVNATLYSKRIITANIIKIENQRYFFLSKILLNLDTSVEDLTLRDCHIRTIENLFFAELIRLQFLNLEDNRLLQLQPSNLAYLTLVVLKLNNIVTGSHNFDDVFYGLQVKLLFARNCNITKFSFGDLAVNGRKTRVIDLSHNQIHTIPLGFEKAFKCLKTVNIYNNRIKCDCRSKWLYDKFMQPLSIIEEDVLCLDRTKSFKLLDDDHYINCRATTITTTSTTTTTTTTTTTPPVKPEAIYRNERESWVIQSWTYSLNMIRSTTLNIIIDGITTYGIYSFVYIMFILRVLIIYKEKIPRYFV